MIKHIVMFKIKDNVNGKTAIENAVEIKKRADVLPSVISCLRGFNAVVNSRNADMTNYEFALICDFDDIDGLNSYQTNPNHLEFAKYLGQFKETRACIDYEY